MEQNNTMEISQNKRNLIKKYIKWIILLICIMIFCDILEDIFQNEIGYFDNTIYSIISNCITEPITTILKLITNLGGAIGLITISLIILIFIKNKKIGIYTSINLIIIAAINQVLKHIIQRPRPIEFRIINENGYSFPSGHSMVSMAFYGFLIYIAYKNIENKYIKIAICIILSILILLIGISRIYLGVHYASDVIGGFCFSIAYLIIYTKIIKEKLNN